MGMDSGEQHETDSSASHAGKDITKKSKAPPRACDCCRKRKVKCDGRQPCAPCLKASIQCAFLQPPKKKGPKGLRSARVLHTLRHMHEASTAPISPVSQPEGFGEWEWTQQNVPLVGRQYHGHVEPQHPHDILYGPHSNPVSEPSTYPRPTATPTSAPSIPPTSFPISRSQTWPAQPDATPSDYEMPRTMSPASTEPTQIRLPGEKFLPYMQLFFDHMFVIMPVIDQSIYGQQSFYSSSNSWSNEVYSFICAVCAATIVQLQARDVELPSTFVPGQPTDDLFVQECLRERQTFDYVGEPSTLSAMTSFFIFVYYGNHENRHKAWYYLQETIAFAENLNMDDESSYAQLEPVEAQWRRRLYWLLFITERAYAIQRSKHARLPHNVLQPEVFNSEHPEMLNGFNNLGKLFAAIDDNFVAAHRGLRKQSLCDGAWLSRMQEKIDKVALVLGDITETQHLDIAVTREWLHVLAWRVGVMNKLQGEGTMSLTYPIELARRVVEITSTATAAALDSHGIGMEQKLNDIASCVADVLQCTADATSDNFLEGKQYLTLLLQKLQTIRGGESRYLQPLVERMGRLTSNDFLYSYDLRHDIHPPAAVPTTYDGPVCLWNGGQLAAPLQDNFPGTFNPAYHASPTDASGGSEGRVGPRWSVTDSFQMLRTLSMSGPIAWNELPGFTEEVKQRRESGFVQEFRDGEGIDWGAWRTGTSGGDLPVHPA